MRNRQLDFLRGVAISIVVFGHALQVIGVSDNQLVLRLIRTFQMELFFAISGYALAYTKVKDPRVGCWKAFKRLAIPYLSWVTISVLALCVTSGFPGAVRVIELYGCSQFWFLRVLFIVVTVFWISRYRRKSSFQLLVYFGSLLWVSLIPHNEMSFKYGVCFLLGHSLNGMKVRDVYGTEESDKFSQTWLGRMFISMGVSSLGIYAVHANVLSGFVDHHFYHYPKLLSSGINEYVVGIALSVVWIVVSLIAIFVIRKFSILKRLLLGE